MSDGSVGSFYVLGSGASSAVPWLACALAPRSPSDDPLGAKIPSTCCAVCADAIDFPLGPNKRGNVSMGLRMTRPDGTGGDFCVVVDCGKTFRDTVARVWPRLEPPLRRIDALLLTHPHADAFMGMDCLREVAPSDPVHVYCHAPTYERVRAAFPYLVTGPPKSGSLTAPVAGAAAAPSPSACCAETASNDASAAAQRAPVTYVANLIFHIVTPWEPFELEGSGGLLVTPIPVEHAGPFGSPQYPDSESCLAFEFGAILQTPPRTQPESATNSPAAAASTITALDSRGLPTLPAWPGDRILWVSDIRALSAEVRVYLASRPVTLLLVDALGFREYPTHFSISQALAMAADVMGPQSATSAAAFTDSQTVSPRVRLVGINHEVDHATEQSRLRSWAASARIARPAAGGEPLAWAEDERSGDSLGLDIELGFDGLSQAVVFKKYYPRLEDYAAEIAAMRGAASALASGDNTNYADLARRRAIATAAARELEATGVAELPRSQRASLEPPPSSIPRSSTTVRLREDYNDSLPGEFQTYRGSPSSKVRGGWVFKAAAFRSPVKQEGLGLPLR